MAKKIMLPSGFVSIQYTEEEQQQTWNQFESYDKTVSSPDYVHKTNDRRELPYQVLKEITLAPDQYELTIRANNKTVTFKCNLLNIQAKTNKKVFECFS